MKDLFEYYEEQPKQLKVICDKYISKGENNGFSYIQNEKWLKDIKPLGYVFDYGLCGEPFNLRKI